MSREQQVANGGPQFSNSYYSPCFIENGGLQTPRHSAGRRFSRSRFNPLLETPLALHVGMARVQRIHVIVDTRLVTPMSPY